MFVDGLLFLALFPLLPVFAERYDLSKVEAALLLAGYQIAFVASAIPAGWLAGRFGARRVVIGGLVSFVAAAALFAVAPTFALLLVARLLQGVSGGTGWSAAMSWLTQNTATGQRSRTVGLISGISSAGAVAGPAVGALAVAIGVPLAFALVGAAGAVALALAIAAPAGRAEGPSPPLLATSGRLVRHPTVLVALAFAGCTAAATATVDLLAVLELGARGVGATPIGVAISTGAILGVAVGAVAGRIGERVGSFALCLAGGVGLAFLPALLALPLPTWALALGLTAIGPLFPLMMTGIYPLIAAASDDLGLAHGTANGFVNICWSVGTGAVPLIAAAIAEAAGDATAFLTATATIAILLAIAVLMRARARNLSLSH